VVVINEYKTGCKSDFVLLIWLQLVYHYSKTIVMTNDEMFGRSGGISNVEPDEQDLLF